MKWTRQKSDSGDLVVVSGPVDEHAEADLQRLETEVSGAKMVTLDLAKTTHFNSVGLAAFIRSGQRLQAKATLQLTNCPMSFLRYMSMLGGANKFRAAIVKAQIPYTCACDKSFEVSKTRAQLIAQEIEAEKCPSCGKSAEVAPMAEDDLETFCTMLRGDEAKKAG